MRRFACMALALMLPGFVLADAGQGQFLGYELGQRYPQSTGTPAQITTTGNLKITAGNPVKPAGVGDVTLVVTPETQTIGFISALTWFETEAEARTFARHYVRLLRVKYPDWEFGREVMDASMRPVEVNLDQDPHNLRIRLTEGRRNGRVMWRISMTLQWLPDTEEAQAWRSLSITEQADVQQQSRDRLLDQVDMRGL